MGRTLGYRTSRLLSVATGGTVGAVALLMVLSPLTMGLVVKAPYTGVASKSDYQDWYGCASSKGSLGFSFTTGIVTGSASGVAKTCTKHLGQVGTSSSVYQEPSVQALVNVHLPSGYHHVATAWLINAAVKGSEVSSNVCPKPAKFSDSSTYSYGSYTYWYNNTGASQYCEALAEVYGSIYSYVDDLTTGQTFNYSYGSLADSYIQSYNSTYWDCYNDTFYNGSAYTYTTGCYGYNTTTTTSAYLGGVYYSTWTGPTNFNNTTSLAQTMYANNTFSGTNHYGIYFEIYVGVNAYAEGWTHASASSSFNMVGPTNGAKLVSISVT